MKNRTISAAVIAGVVAAAGGWTAYQKTKKPDLPRQRAVTVVEGPIEETVEATGSVSPLNRVEIKPPISGRIEKLLVDEGDLVEAGQILAWMSSSDRAAILDAARAEGPESVKRWEQAYRPTPVIAPLSGVVILKNVVVGQTVEASLVLFAISDSLIVLGQVDESDIGRVRVGMPARIVLDAFPDQPVEGKVIDILFEGKNVSNVITYGVKVRPMKAPAFFRSQMTANLGFILARKENALIIPANVVRQSDGGKRVAVVGPDGQPSMREITTGIETGELVEVLSGLSAGEKVLPARGRYVPQQGPQASPLSGGRRPNQGNTGEAPRPRRR
jgi:membrane fusion protein, macrolide-specific efflux system